MRKQLLNWRVEDNLNTTSLAISLVYKPLALSVMQKKKKEKSYEYKYLSQTGNVETYGCYTVI